MVLGRWAGELRLLEDASLKCLWWVAHGRSASRDLTARGPAQGRELEGVRGGGQVWDTSRGNSLCLDRFDTNVELHPWVCFPGGSGAWLPIFEFGKGFVR